MLTSSGSFRNINPIRYRGYYFDTETGLYYLKSRYYDPQVGRFINADILADADRGSAGLNLFAYCLDDPVNNLDETGLWTVAAGADFSFSKGLRVSGGAQFARDDDGQYGVIFYLGGGIGTPSAAAAGTFTVTNADTIDDLRKWGFAVGESGFWKDIEASISPAIKGVTFSKGLTNPTPEIHAELTYTWVIPINSAVMRQFIDYYLDRERQGLAYAIPYDF